jgi:RNA polymerase sigma-B factor
VEAAGGGYAPSGMSATDAGALTQTEQSEVSRADEDRLLFERLADRGDPVDREVLVERFLPLARSIAARYQHRGEPFEDIFQVACIGLVKAIDRFDVARGRAFSSYAVPTIAGEIKRYYRDKTWSVRVPRDLQELTLRVDRARQDLETELARSPTVSELAQRLEVDEEDVIEALQARHAKGSVSLDAPSSEEDPEETLGERVGTEEDGYRLAEHRTDLATLTRILTARERLVLRMRFEQDMTQQEIGDQIGVSQMQVSRILRSAITRLHAQADPTGDDSATVSR